MLHALEDLMVIHHQEVEELKVFIDAGGNIYAKYQKNRKPTT